MFARKVKLFEQLIFLRLICMDHAIQYFNIHLGAASNAELFSWDTDRDILIGNSEFETRLVMQPLTREQLEQTLTKPFRIHLGWDTLDSWKHGVHYY